MIRIIIFVVSLVFVSSFCLAEDTAEKEGSRITEIHAISNKVVAEVFDKFQYFYRLAAILGACNKPYLAERVRPTKLEIVSTLSRATGVDVTRTKKPELMYAVGVSALNEIRAYTAGAQEMANFLILDNQEIVCIAAIERVDKALEDKKDLVETEKMSH
ncbi:MAG: hypothetical protein ACN4GW_08315 [Desulforhopalus sp.]